MKQQICRKCGKLFTPKKKSERYCHDDHYAVCEMCGKPFVIPRNKLGSATWVPLCSTECVNRYKGMSHQRTKLQERTCSICGDKFLSKSANARICPKKHYFTCKVCGKVFEPNHQQLLSNTQTCSDKCRYLLAQSTYQSNYGKDTNPEGHDKLLKRYEASMLDKYGVSNPFQSNEIIQRALATKREKYGEHFEGITEKIQSTTEQRYGTRFLMQTAKFKEQARQTCIKKYGVDNYAKSSHFLKTVITNPLLADNCKAFRDDPQSFIDSHFDHKPTLAELSEVCGIRDSSVGWIINEAGLADLVQYTYSRMEDELSEFLHSILPKGAIIQQNTFRIITPYELDIYLPEYSFAIECNPTITHNSTIPGWDENDSPKPIDYHKMKTDMCEEHGVFLFHIFGYEWSYKSDILKSMISNILGCSLYKVYARRTTVKEVSDADAMSFLEASHRQGGVHSSIRLGLYQNDELVSLMTFSRTRYTIGRTSQDSDSCYELVRFCNKLNTNVVGGASKLFKHFVEHYQPDCIISFSDRAHTTGKMYEKLGFIKDHVSDPGYMWVDLVTDRGYARSNAQKSNIKQFLKDDTIDLSKTEVQIMSEHKFVQVFDSGVICWKWRKD